MSHQNNRQENPNKNIGLAILVLSLLFAMQYWKPDFYWNSPKTKFLRGIIGDRGVDITVYAVVAINFLGMVMLFINKLRN